MKAAVLNATKQVAQLDIPAPVPAAGETLVQVSHSGICGTDLKIYEGGIPVEYPRIMGHESVGEVVQSDAYTSGTPVIVDPAYFCGDCFHCHNGQTHICPNGGLIGRDVDGGFADYVIAPTRNIHPLPTGIDPAAAPLLQPMTTCLHAQRLSSISPGESVIVQGLGVTGLLHIQLARTHGAYPVIGITRSPWKRDLALKLGADFVFIGRPFLYAMGAEGYTGLQAMIELISSQIDISLAQIGCTDINHVDASYIMGAEPK